MGDEREEWRLYPTVNGEPEPALVADYADVYVDPGDDALCVDVDSNMYGPEPKDGMYRIAIPMAKLRELLALQDRAQKGGG